MEKKRSIGVTVYSITIILFGLCTLIFVAFRTILSEAMVFCLASFPEFLHQMLMVSLSLLAFPIVCIVIGVGLLKLKNWARFLLFISVIILIVFGLLDIIEPRFSGFLFRHIDIIDIYDELFILIMILFIPALFFFYTHPAVKEQFK